MRKKEKTYENIVQAVSRGFRKMGYAGAGVDGLARSAGVTSGAFYAHVGSKNDAFMIALAKGLDEVLDNLPDFQKEHGEGWVSAFAEYYMGRAHIADLECGCAMATLTGEVVRQGGECHALYQEKMEQIFELVAQGLRGDNRRERSVALIAILTGGLNLARAMQDERSISCVAETIKVQAMMVAGDVIAAPV